MCQGLGIPSCYLNICRWIQFNLSSSKNGRIMTLCWKKSVISCGMACVAYFVWHNRIEEFQPNTCHQSELSVENGCVSWRSRVVILSPARAKVFDILHKTHHGITWMKCVFVTVMSGHQVWMLLWRTELKDVPLQRISEVVSKGPSVPVGIAWTCLGPGACGFWGTVWRQYVPFLIIAHALKMDGGASCEARYISTHDTEVENSFHCSWPSWDACYWQWLTVYECWVLWLHDYPS